MKLSTIALVILIPTTACAQSFTRPMNADVRPLNAGVHPLNAGNSNSTAFTGPMCIMMVSDVIFPSRGEHEVGVPLACADCEREIATTSGMAHSCDENHKCVNIQMSRRCVPVGGVGRANSRGN